ncbi:MAG: TIGR04551 family protein, partial [Myxococcota bacterium]
DTVADDAVDEPAPEPEPEPEPELELEPTLAEPDVEETDDDDDDVDDALELLAESEPPSSDPTVALPTTPQPVFSLHGYFRTRGEIWDNFFLGRDADALNGFDPFRGFRPADRGAFIDGSSGCNGATNPDGSPAAIPADCGSDRIAFANMRLRIAPTLSLSDDVQVHMMIDAFDNLILGSTPESEVYLPPGSDGVEAGADGRFRRATRVPGVPVDTLAATQNPPQAFRNSERDAIYVRRAWASVRNRDLGQLRFGRMGSHWGLGILHNSGDGIDADFSTDVDRVMAIAELFGINLIAAYDFASQGIVNGLTNDLRGVPFDLTAKDDTRQYVFAAAYRADEREAAERLARGGWVLEGGLFYIHRRQSLSSFGTSNPFSTEANDISFVRRNGRLHTPDLWARFRMGGLRLEVEAAAVLGDIRNVGATFDGNGEDRRLLQFGVAFEGEYRLLDDKLSIRLYTGYATGDRDVDGLSARSNLLGQATGDNRATTFSFHPNYRIDLILWRNIMERVSGAWYLRPGVSYDLIRSPFGRLLGASVDVIYSRAAQEVQTYGSDPNLGLELDFSLYYRSEDGPEIFDGFYAM